MVGTGDRKRQRKSGSCDFGWSHFNEYWEREENKLDRRDEVGDHAYKGKMSTIERTVGGTISTLPVENCRACMCSRVRCRTPRSYQYLSCRH